MRSNVPCKFGQSHVRLQYGERVCLIHASSNPGYPTSDTHASVVQKQSIHAWCGRARPSGECARTHTWTWRSKSCRVENHRDLQKLAESVYPRASTESNSNNNRTNHPPLCTGMQLSRKIHLKAGVGRVTPRPSLPCDLLLLLPVLPRGPR